MPALQAPTGPQAPMGMAGHIVAFSQLLKEAGLSTHPQAVVDACRSVSALDIGDRRGVYWALRANLVTDHRHFDAFERLYRLFWEEGVCHLPRPPAPPPGILPIVAPGLESNGRPGSDTPGTAGGASARELLVHKDLRSLTPAEEPHLREILLSLLAKLATRPGRRTRPAARGRGLEFRHTFRHSARHGAEILRLVQRERKVRRRRLAFLGDVSGSMDPYSRFFLLLAHALGRQERNAEVYAFSTRLFRLTGFLREREASRFIERLMAENRGWSGGTQIGECLGAFRRALAQRPHLRHTVVVILSDGWDRGDPELLRREVTRLKAETARIYWLNPLKGDPGYRPLCRGMATVLPYLDGFHPAHNADSLARFSRQLARLR